jgi:hypothetical protein
MNDHSLTGARISCQEKIILRKRELSPNIKNPLHAQSTGIFVHTVHASLNAKPNRLPFYNKNPQNVTMLFSVIQQIINGILNYS